MVFNALGTGNYWQDIANYPHIYLPTYEGCETNHEWQGSDNLYIAEWSRE